MAVKGKTRQALRVKANKIASRENAMYYQNGNAWKMPASDRERIARRKLEE